MKEKLKIKLTGANGYLGRLISEELIKKGYEVSGINRSLLYDGTGKLKNELKNTDVVINLAGAPILQRWTKKNKTTIYDSRVTTTQNIVKAINELPENNRPEKFISASAIGIYRAGEKHNENSKKFEPGFVGEVVRSWEKPLEKLPETVQTVILRIGLVLGKEAKTIKNLLFPFKLGLGATIGDGKQPFPFVHEKDVSRAFLWAVEDFQESAAFNLTAPENITNKKFTKALAKSLHRPALFSIPGFVFKILYGKAAVLITGSPAVSSRKITDAGFRFIYPDIESALLEITK